LKSTRTPHLLVVEDEFLIRILLIDMLDELGYTVAAAVGTIAEAAEVAKSGDFDAAILDVNLDGKSIFPIAEILANRKVPFIFVTGYGQTCLPPSLRDRPTLQKPFQTDELKNTLEKL
jgi:DNA-binding response OmpR family regulator